MKNFLNKYLPFTLAVVLLATAGFFWVNVQKTHASFNYSRSITVNSGQVPSTQTDFPMLVAGTYSSLATVANGGHVINSSGYDVGFYSNANCSTGKLTWETELYNPTTGQFAYWIKISALSVGTTIYMCYGDATITTDQSNKAAVWSNNYFGVWHLNGTGSLVDSLGSNNGTNHGTSNGSGTGFIPGTDSVNFSSASSTYVDLGGNSFDTHISVTAEVWFKPTVAANMWLLGKSTNVPQGLSMADLGASGGEMYTVFNEVNGGNATVLNSDTPSVAPLNSWSMLSAQLTNPPNTSIQANEYLNGAPVTLLAAGTFYSAQTMPNNSQPLIIGNSGNVNAFFDGSIAQVTYAGFRFPSWITTEYNNQSSPSSFYTMSSENSFLTPTTFSRVSIKNTRVSTCATNCVRTSITGK